MRRCVDRIREPIIVHRKDRPQIRQIIADVSQIVVDGKLRERSHETLDRVRWSQLRKQSGLFERGA